MLVSSAKKKHLSFQFKFFVTFADKFVAEFRKKPDASVETDSQSLCHKATSVFHQSLAFTGIQSVKCFSLEKRFLFRILRKAPRINFDADGH